MPYDNNIVFSHSVSSGDVRYQSKIAVKQHNVVDALIVLHCSTNNTKSTVSVYRGRRQITKIKTRPNIVLYLNVITIKTHTV